MIGRGRVPQDRRIDRASPVPLYYQLQEILKREIEDGRWRPGSLLPSEADLVAGFGISRTVIRKALDVLESDGQVQRRKGKGTVVAPPKFRYEAVAAARDWLGPDIAEAAVLWRLIHVAPAPAGAYLARLLSVTSDEPVWDVVFVSAVGGRPVSLSQMSLRGDASPALEALRRRDESPRLVAGEADVLDQLAERYGLQPYKSEVTVESTTVNEFEAEQLGVAARAPMFLLSMLSKSAADRPLAFIRTVVRSDHFRFSVVVRHPASDSPSDQVRWLDCADEEVSAP